MPKSKRNQAWTSSTDSLYEDNTEGFTVSAGTKNSIYSYYLLLFFCQYFILLPFLQGMGGESFHYNSNKIISYLLEV